MKPKAKLLVIVTYGALFLFMAKMTGVPTAALFFGLIGSVYLLMVVVPRIFGDKPSGCNDEGFGYRYSYRYGSKYRNLHKR